MEFDKKLRNAFVMTSFTVGSILPLMGGCQTEEVIKPDSPVVKIEREIFKLDTQIAEKLKELDEKVKHIHGDRDYCELIQSAFDMKKRTIRNAAVEFPLDKNRQNALDNMQLLLDDLEAFSNALDRAEEIYMEGKEAETEIQSPAKVEDRKEDKKPQKPERERSREHDPASKTMYA